MNQGWCTIPVSRDQDATKQLHGILIEEINGQDYWFILVHVFLIITCVSIVQIGYNIET